ncbi:AAA family ATPase [Mediterraneibacter sp. NSJ-55]|uniref:AAA family ATPase n=1 Tax=Mediterraneibacter hominis TaxID=2763054 RepID=A0A923LGW9_9FIRM|nr:AAA family ATPase [Mediterraneibacter hominis]MBC5688085.1 AAA family ATPase [Mediterraneibacter hominis]
MDNMEILEFKMVPVSERYYNEDTSWGVFNFTTKDKIPEYLEYKDPLDDKAVTQKMSTIAGKMQQLYVGSEYLVKARCEYNEKFHQYQYVPISIIAIIPQSQEEQKLFLKSLVSSESIADNILYEYPNVIEDVMNGGLIDLEYDKIRGVGKKTWDKIRESIIKNYIISDIITLLQPMGVTFNMIKRLLDAEPNPSLLKQKLKENPYIMVKAIKGLGFKRIDDMALKIKPDLRVSNHRLTAFIMFYLKECGESGGHTWVYINNLKNAISDTIPECYNLLDDLLEHNTFLYIEEDKVGSKEYRHIEEKIFNILVSKQNLDNHIVVIEDDNKVDEYIKEAEKEQGFQYTEEQKNVITQSIQSNLIIISGKAGTGKSSISRGILKVYQGFNYRISTCALSAKAAQRITEATGFASSTIHRLLGSQGLNEFTYNFQNPLPTDVLLIDEGSMINAGLFLSLLEAVNDTTRIIICGDHMQLPPIGYGNVFSDIIHRSEFNSYQLTKPMRQAELSGILSDANLIRDGISPLSEPSLKIIRGKLKDMYYMFRDNREALQNIAIQTFLKSIETEDIGEVVIITPRKQNCINSSIELNKIIQEKLLGSESKFISYGETVFKLGAKVMQITNNYEKNIFNGEIGYITYIGEKNEEKKKVKYCEVEYNDLAVSFDRKKIVEYKMNELSEIELAYAMTCHKCVTEDTMLFSTNGIIELNELNNNAGKYESKILNDDVPYVYNGYELEKPKAFYNAGISECLIISSQRGYSLTATPDHKINVLGKDGYIIPKYAKDITNDDYVVIIKNSNIYGDKISLPDNWKVDLSTLDIRTSIYEIPTYLTKEFARFLGYMVADGVVSNHGIKYGKNHKNVVLDFNNVIYQIFGYKAKEPRNVLPGGTMGGMYLSEISSKHIKAFCENIDGIQPNNKFVPHVIMSAPKEIQIEFLRGVFEDGSVCVKNNKFEHISFTSACEKLVNQIQMLLLNMGIISTKLKRSTCCPNGTNAISYNLFLYGTDCDKFIKTIGFISNEKEKKSYKYYEQTGKTSSNYAIPYIKNIIEKIVKDYNIPRNKISYKIMRKDRRNISYASLKLFLQFCNENNIYNNDVKYLDYLYHNTSIQKVKDIHTTIAQTYCIEMPKTHQFVQNGFSAWNCQGSGFRTVIGIIDKQHYTLLDNCMLYTLLTRAKTRCLLLAEPQAFMRCIRTNHNTSRQTWMSLPDSIKENQV